MVSTTVTPQPHLGWPYIMAIASIPATPARANLPASRTVPALGLSSLMAVGLDDSDAKVVEPAVVITAVVFLAAVWLAALLTLTEEELDGVGVKVAVPFLVSNVDVTVSNTDVAVSNVDVMVWTLDKW